MTAIPADILRQLIREVVQECLTTVRDEQIAVQVRTNDDLNAFVRQILHMADDPPTRARLDNGQITFSLDTGTPSSAKALVSRDVPVAGSDRVVDEKVAAPKSAAQTPRAGFRLAKGALTEKQVNEAVAAGHDTIVLGRRAVATPLGRERARALKVTLTKEQS